MSKLLVNYRMDPQTKALLDQTCSEWDVSKTDLVCLGVRYVCSCLEADRDGQPHPPIEPVLRWLTGGLL